MTNEKKQLIQYIIDYHDQYDCRIRRIARTKRLETYTINLKSATPQYRNKINTCYIELFQYQTIEGKQQVNIGYNFSYTDNDGNLISTDYINKGSNLGKFDSLIKDMKKVLAKLNGIKIDELETYSEQTFAIVQFINKIEKEMLKYKLRVSLKLNDNQKSKPIKI